MKINWIFLLILMAGQAMATGDQAAVSEKEQEVYRVECEDLSLSVVDPKLAKNPQLQKAIVSCLAPREEDHDSVAKK